MLLIDFLIKVDIIFLLAKKKYIFNSFLFQDVFIFVTSYEIAINDRRHFKDISWRYIVVDEAHRLKNKDCKLIEELKNYSSTNRLLLTGTPLQNNLDELWSLLNFLMPEIFDVRVFQSWYDARDLYLDGDEEKQRIIQQEREHSILNTMHQVLTPFILRRVKADVDLSIPPKKELLVHCPMTKIQKDYYAATVNETIGELVGGEKSENEKQDSVEVDLDSGRPRRSSANFDYKMILELEEGELSDEKLAALAKMEEKRSQRYVITSPYKCSSSKSESKSEIRISLRYRMMDLIKSSNHPYLIKHPIDDFGCYLADEQLIEQSGKMKVLDQLLRNLLERKHKVLIFSQIFLIFFFFF